MKISNKLLHTIRRLVTTKMRWRNPPRSQVLIFDACNHAPLLTYLSHLHPVLLPVRWEEINIPVLIASVFKSGRRGEAYIDAFIEAVAPKIIVTFIDNTVAFYRLKSRHPHRTTMFIQNGWRTYDGDIFMQLGEPDDTRHFQVDYMLCFNAAVAGLYRQHIQGSSMAIGSLKNNCYPKSNKTEAGSIGYISQWMEGGFPLRGKLLSQEDFIGQVDRIILPVLQERARSNGAPLYVIPRTQAGSDKRILEEAYFTNLLSCPCRFLEYAGPGSSYQAIDAVEIVVGVDSTLAYESLARGNKTAIFSIRGHLLDIPSYRFGWPSDFPDTGPFWTNLPDKDALNALLDSLFAFSEKEWQKMLEHFKVDRLMHYDPENRLLRKLIEQIANHS